LKNVYVLGLGLEKKVLALALALKNFHILGLGQRKNVSTLALKIFMSLALDLRKKSWPWP